MEQTKEKKPKRNANETKADRFRRLAVLRTNKAIKAIRQIGDLASAASEYTPEQTTKIKAAINAELEKTMQRFGGKKPIGDFNL